MLNEAAQCLPASWTGCPAPVCASGGKGNGERWPPERGLYAGKFLVLGQGLFFLMSRFCRKGGLEVAGGIWAVLCCVTRLQRSAKGQTQLATRFFSVLPHSGAWGCQGLRSPNPAESPAITQECSPPENPHNSAEYHRVSLE